VSWDAVERRAEAFGLWPMAVDPGDTFVRQNGPSRFSIAAARWHG
jgi:hypothetical protein